MNLSKLFSVEQAEYIFPVYRLSALQDVPYMPSLQALYLQDNNITSIAPLHSVPMLSVLNLGFNKLEGRSDLESLRTCTNLGRLDLHGCPIEDNPG